MSPESEWSWGDVAGEVTPRTDTVDLVLDANIGAQLDEARAHLTEVRRSSDTLADTDIAEARTEVERLERAAAESVRAFTVRSTSYRRWREMMEASPPREEGARWYPTTFVPAVLLECCDQFRSEGDVAQAIEVLTTGQVARLFNAARKLNEGDGQVPTGRGR